MHSIAHEKYFHLTDKSLSCKNKIRWVSSAGLELYGKYHVLYAKLCRDKP